MKAALLPTVAELSFSLLFSFRYKWRLPSIIVQLCYGLYTPSLHKKFINIAVNEDDYYDQRDDKGAVPTQSARKFEALSCVCFADEFVPAPSISCGAEEDIYQRAQRQQVVADNEVFQIKDYCAAAQWCER